MEGGGPHPFQSEYVAKLKQKFDHLALFFYNQLEGSQVGVIWKPNAFFPRNFSALHSLQRTFVDDQSASVVDAAAVMSEMVALGNGIVDHLSIR
jgi:hypothetical protein